MINDILCTWSFSTKTKSEHLHSYIWSAPILHPITWKTHKIMSITLLNIYTNIIFCLTLMGKLKKRVGENKNKHIQRYVGICNYQLGFFTGRHKQMRGRICFSLEISIFILVLIVFKIAERKYKVKKTDYIKILHKKLNIWTISRDFYWITFIYSH